MNAPDRPEAYGPSFGLLARGPFGFWEVCFVLAFVLQAFSLLAMPVVYDTMHLPDTLFLLNEGWRVSQGLRPGVEYETFYGGFTSGILALAFRLFGAEVRTLDLVPLLHAAIVLALAAAILFRRTSLFSGLATVALLATVLMTRAPLEEHVALTQPISAHSFSYNRLGLALCLVVLPFILLPRDDDRILEPLAGMAAGAAMAMALLCKWSFAVIPLVALLALLLQRRWSAFGGALAGLLAAGFVLDPFGAQFLGSLAYMQEAARAEEMIGGAGALTGLAFKSLNTLLSHLPVMLALLAAIFLSLREGQAEGRWTWLGGMVLMVAGFGAVCVVMGPFGLIGQQVAPVAAVLMILCFERAWQADAQSAPILRVLVLVGSGAFLLPNLGNTVAITAAGLAKRDEVLITNGPMANYLQRYDRNDLAGSPEAVMDAVATDLARTRTVTRGMEYPVFVDGLLALDRLQGISDLGVIADGSFNYEFALGSVPVVGYPLWPRPSSPEIAATGGIPAEAAVVMILRHDAGNMGKILKARVGNEFALCLQTGIWDIFARKSARISGCKAS